MNKPALGCTLIVALLASEPAAGASGDPWSRAAALETAGQPAAAAAALEALVPDYPQDYALFVRLGWLHFEAGAWAAAERRYGDALGLNPESWDARLGLAWTLQRAGRRAQAADRFERLHAERPDDSSAAEGRELTRSRRTWVANGYAGAHDYGSHSEVSSGWSVGADASVLAETWALGGGYRFSSYTYDPARGEGDWAADQTSSSVQHMLHARASWGLEAFGGGLWTALLIDDVDTLDDARVGGLSLRWSPWGDLRLDGIGGWFDPRTIYAARLSWRLPVTSWLDVTPIGEVQSDDGTTRVSGGARLALHGRHGALWVDGRLGQTRNPVDPDAPAIWSISGLVGPRGAVGGRLNLGDWFLFATAEAAEVEVDADTTWSETSTALWVGGGLGLTFSN